MIDQQYYTREKKGIFNRTPGFDTIAISNGLKTRRDFSSFIRNILHDKCFYDTPKEFSLSGENDISKCPESLICFNSETGEMIVGRSVFAGKDFTGERNRFFQHNYVIPREEKEKFIKNIEKVVYSKDFKEDYNIDIGMDIEQVVDIPYDSKIEGPIDRLKLFNEIGAESPEVFKKILYAVMMSVFDKKRVYICLNVPIEKISECARELLEYIYKSLPYEYRRNIGFITYVREPISKKNINIMFTEKGGIKPTSNEIKKEYVFDFSQNIFLNTDIDISKQIYIQYITQYAKENERLEQFFNFLEEKTQGLKPADKLQISRYNDLCTFYTIEQGDMFFYEANRVNTFTNLYNYINMQGFQKQKEWLNSLFLKVIDKEINDINGGKVNYIPSIEIIDMEIKYHKIASPATKEKISKFIAKSILIGKMNNRIEYVNEILNKTKANAEIFKELINTLFDGGILEKEIFEWYLKGCLINIKNINDLFKEIDFWGETSPNAIKNQIFKQETEKKLLEYLMDSKNVIVNGKKIREYLSKFNKKYSFSSQKSEYKLYSNNIMDKINEHVYENIDLNSITKGEISELDFTYINKINDNKAEIIKCIYKIEHNQINNVEEDFYNHVKKEFPMINTVKSLILKFYGDDIKENRFDRIILAFYEDYGYRFDHIIDFISTKSEKKNVYEYILWSADNIDLNNSLSRENYLQSIQDYFMKKDRQAFRDKSIKKKLYGVNNKKLRNLFDDLERELASGFEKIRIRAKQALSNFFESYGEIIMIILLAAVVCGGIIFGTYKLVNLYISTRTEIQDSKPKTTDKPKVKDNNVNKNEIDQGSRNQNIDNGNKKSQDSEVNNTEKSSNGKADSQSSNNKNKSGDIEQQKDNNNSDNEDGQ